MMMKTLAGRATVYDEAQAQRDLRRVNSPLNDHAEATHINMGSTMIHLQVHLQIPCYDFYPVQAIAIELFPAAPRPEGVNAAVRSPLETAQSRTATGGVYKWQGRNQRELMTHTY